MQWSSPHTVIRLVVAVVICACAITTATWKITHTRVHVVNVTEKTRTITVQVKQGDGYLTEAQCRSIKKNDKMSGIRSKYGFPVGTQAYPDWEWEYPLRENHKRHCSIWFSDHFGPLRKGNRVDSIKLDLVGF